jgi:hypothetical protein
MYPFVDAENFTPSSTDDFSLAFLLLGDDDGLKMVYVVAAPDVAIEPAMGASAVPARRSESVAPTRRRIPIRAAIGRRGAGSKAV